MIGRFKVCPAIGQTLQLPLVLLLCGFCLSARAADRVERETWSLVSMQGALCGFNHVTVMRRETSAGVLYVTTERQEFQFKRLGRKMKIVCGSKITEDEKGIVLGFTSFSHGLGSNIALLGFRDGEKMILQQKGTRQTCLLPRTALGPEALNRFMHALPLKPESAGGATVFMAESPQAPVKISMLVVDREKVNADRPAMELWKVINRSTLVPGLDTIDYVDAQGEAHLSIIPFPGIGELRLVRADRNAVAKPLEAPELFLPSLIQPDKPLSAPRQLTAAKFRLRYRSSQFKPALWSGPGQTISAAGSDALIVEVKKSTDDNQTHWQLPHAADNHAAPFLEATPYLEQTPLIRKLSAQALAGEKNPARAARRIESFVHAYINKKNLDIGFASADETARSREGDCTEHTVLAAALGRAAGLPMRVVVGLVYLPPESAPVDKPNGVFGFHMWAEAQIGPDQWLPIDPTLGGFDATHIAAAKTSLNGNDPMTELALPVFGLLNHLSIEVVHSESTRMTGAKKTN